MPEPAAIARAGGRLAAIERRFWFAAWPQAQAHPSWLQALDALTGLTVSRAWGPGVGAAEHAVAQALLVQAGAHPVAAPLPVDRLPAWLLQRHEAMRHQAATVAALTLVAELRLAISGEAARHWDSVLGPGVRRAALLLSQRQPSADLPEPARQVRRLALAAARSADGWHRFCLQLVLTALNTLLPVADGLAARVRLAWPHALRDAVALPLPPDVATWLARCLDATQRLAAPGPATPGPAAPNPDAPGSAARLPLTEAAPCIG